MKKNRYNTFILYMLLIFSRVESSPVQEAA